jgi:hypothetical protein
MKKTTILILSALFFGAIVGSLLSNLAFQQTAAAQSQGVTLRVYRGTTDANGRVEIPHDFPGGCERDNIIGMTAAIQNDSNAAWYVPGDNTWIEGRTFMAWDANKFTVQIDEETGWYKNQDVYVVAFLQPRIC